MEYDEAVAALERRRRLRPKLGTETTASLLAHLGDPHEATTAVQVAGSNGKGSTARLLERILVAAGLDVGLYTSPHLHDLRERIRVNGREIPRREVVRFVADALPDDVDASVEDGPPTFFETVTAMALWHFERADVDVAVLEVGIGGRYDATSVVDPAAAAVTSVSLEHTDIIGSTVEEIAADKAQVAARDAPLVTGATGPALDAIRDETPVVTVGGADADVCVAEGEVRVGVADDDVRVAEGDRVGVASSAVSLAGPDWGVETTTPLLGHHQAVNAGIAATLARQVAAATGAAVTEADLAAGIRNAHWPGRFEVMDESPLVVLDGAHNPDACEKLARVLDRFDYDDLHLVFGAMRDKDVREMSRALPAAGQALLVEHDVDRAQDVDSLAAVFDRETDAATAAVGPVREGVSRALRDADADDCVLVTGSLYVVAAARERWTGRTPARQVRDRGGSVR